MSKIVYFMEPSINIQFETSLRMVPIQVILENNPHIENNVFFFIKSYIIYNI